MTSTPTEDASGRAEADAIEWLARLRAPNGEAEQAAFERWFMADTEHADAYERVLSTWEASSAVARTPIAEQRGATGAPAPRRSRRWLVAIGAIVLAAIIGGGLSVFPFGRGAPSLVTSAYASDVGAIRTVRLSDQSVVTLDSDSQVQVVFDQDARRLVLVRGRARFAPANDPKRDFIVSAGSQRIAGQRAVFDVDLGQGRPIVDVLRGAATIEGGGAAPLKLAAGQSSGRDEGAGRTRDGQSGQRDDRWPSGMVSFENAPLAKVIARSNRYARTQIRLADDSVGDLRFTGTFDPRATDDLARMLAATFKLRPSRNVAGDITLSRATARPVK